MSQHTICIKFILEENLSRFASVFAKYVLKMLYFLTWKSVTRMVGGGRTNNLIKPFTSQGISQKQKLMRLSR